MREIRDAGLSTTGQTKPRRRFRAASPRLQSHVAWKHTSTGCDLFVFDHKFIELTDKQQGTRRQSKAFILLLKSLCGVRGNRAAIGVTNGYGTDSHHCRYRSSAWRRRLLRPWTLVLTPIPSKSHSGRVPFVAGRSEASDWGPAPNGPIEPACVPSRLPSG